MPVFIWFALFFEYISLFSLILVASVFIFRDLKIMNLLWILLIVSILLDIALHFWIGTHLLVITFALLVLYAFDRFVNNVFFDILAVFLTFLFFRIFYSFFISFQEVGVLNSFSLGILLQSIVFALKNLFVYLIIRFLGHILKSYFRGNAF